jgi:uncharacterized protein YjdB
MRFRTLLVRSFVLCVVGALTLACSDQGIVNTNGLPIRFVVNPNDLDLESGESATIVAYALDGTNRRFPVPASFKVSWVASDAELLRVDPNGNSATVTALGDGTGQVDAQVSAVDGSMGMIAARAEVNAYKTPAQLTVVSGNNQTSSVSKLLTQQMVIRAVDFDENPLVGVPVSWEVTSGGGSAVRVEVRTDSEGYSHAKWTLGPTIGKQSIRASSKNVAAFFTATGVQSGPTSVVKVGGDGQTGLVGSRLPDSLTVQVRDALGNGVSGVTVYWTTSSTTGTVSPTSKVTNADGYARTAWTLSAAGAATARASVPGLAAGQGDAIFTATGTQPAGSPTVARLVITPKPVTINALGAQVPLVATAYDANSQVVSGAPISWNSSNTTVAAVDNTGRITARAAGTALIVAVAVCCNKADTTSVTIAQQIASLALNPKTASIQVGGAVSLTATARDASSTIIANPQLSWSTSNSAVATVSNGAVTGVGAGTATIKVTSGSYADSAVITVSTSSTQIGPVTSVTVSPPSGNITVGFTQQFVAIAKDANGNVVPGQTFQWSSTNATVASVSLGGLVSALVVGSATITASTAGKSGSATITVATNSVNLPTGLTTVIDARGDDKYYGRAPAPSPGNAYIVGDINFGAGWTDTPTSSTTSGVWIVNDAAAPSGKSIQKNYPAGATQGFNGQVTAGFGPWKAFHVRMTIMYSPNWQSMADKWFYFGSDGARAIFYFGISPQGTLQFHAQNTGPGIVTGPDGAAVYRSQTDISFGVYHTLEVYAVAQSAPGAPDANFWVWFDGKPVTQWQFLKGTDPRNGSVRSLTNLNLFDVGTTNLERMTYGGFQEFVYWGGTGTKTQNDWVRQAEFLVQGK